MGRLGRASIPFMTAPSGANRLSLAAALVAGSAYSTFASFVANALTPVSGRLIELDSHRRVISGRYQEVFSWDGVLPIVLGSMAVFAMVWWITRVMLDRWEPGDFAEPLLSSDVIAGEQSPFVRGAQSNEC
jgi:hypothetical protein